MRAPRRSAGRVAAAIGVALFIVLAGTGVSSAGWTTTPGTTTGSVTAATTAVTVAGSGTTATAYKFTGAATNSNSSVRALTVTNSGTAPLSYTIGVTGVTGTLPPAAVRLTVWRLPSGTCSTTAGAGATVGTLAAPPALPAGGNSATAGVSFTLCALTSLTTTVAQSQGQNLAATLTVTGRVGDNWTTTASDGAALTQSVYRVVDPGSFACSSPNNALSNSPATLTWTAPAATPNVSYRVVVAGTDPATILKQTTATTVSFAPNEIAGSVQVLVQAVESTYGTVSVGIPVTLTESSSGLFGLFQRVSCS